MHILREGLLRLSLIILYFGKCAPDPKELTAMRLADLIGVYTISYMGK